MHFMQITCSYTMFVVHKRITDIFQWNSNKIRKGHSHTNSESLYGLYSISLRSYHSEFSRFLCIYGLFNDAVRSSDICKPVDKCLRESTEDGSSMFLRNVGIYLQVHMALQPRKQLWHLHQRHAFKSQTRRRTNKTEFRVQQTATSQTTTLPSQSVWLSLDACVERKTGSKALTRTRRLPEAVRNRYMCNPHDGVKAQDLTNLKSVTSEWLAAGPRQQQSWNKPVVWFIYRAFIAGMTSSCARETVIHLE
jgi:hypothetical protein